MTECPVTLVFLKRPRSTNGENTSFAQNPTSSERHISNTNPTSRPEELSRERAHKAYQKYLNRFESEKSIAGATAWNMANAYTGWLQHEHRAGRDPQKSATRRLHSSLFGLLADRSVHTFQSALNI